MPVVVLAMGLGWQGEASASSAGVMTEAEHAKYCKCRNCRIESCCCVPRDPEPPEPTTKRRGETLDVLAAEPAGSPDESAPQGHGPPPAGAVGPCMGAAPCGDPGLPTPPNSTNSGDSALLMPGRDLPTDPLGQPLLPGVSRRPPEPPRAPLDEPPEPARLA